MNSRNPTTIIESTTKDYLPTILYVIDLFTRRSTPSSKESRKTFLFLFNTNIILI